MADEILPGTYVDSGGQPMPGGAKSGYIMGDNGRAIRVQDDDPDDSEATPKKKVAKKTKR